MNPMIKDISESSVCKIDSYSHILLKNHKPHKVRYRNPIGLSTQNTSYTYYLLDSNHTELDNCFQNQIVLDLGAGSNAYGYEFAQNNGAVEYIGVEHFHFQELYDNLSKSKINIPAYVAPVNLLKALNKTKSDSVSIITSGIMCDLFPYLKNKELDDFIEEIWQEIIRVLSPSGKYVCYQSMFSPDESKIPDKVTYSGLSKIEDNILCTFQKKISNYL